MPYKDKNDKKKHDRDYISKVRGTTLTGTTEGGTTEMVPASYIPGKDGRMYQFLPERPRYLTLSDGQVLDRRKWLPLQGTG